MAIKATLNSAEEAQRVADELASKFPISDRKYEVGLVAVLPKGTKFRRRVRDRR